jgi:hypothetical protein
VLRQVRLLVNTETAIRWHRSTLLTPRGPKSAKRAMLAPRNGRGSLRPRRITTASTTALLSSAQPDGLLSGSGGCVDGGHRGAYVAGDVGVVGSRLPKIP